MTVSKLSPATVNDAPTPTPSLHVQLHAQPPANVIHRPDGQLRQCRASPLRAPLPFQRESCLCPHWAQNISSFLPLPFAVRDRLFPCFPFSHASLPPCLSLSSPPPLRGNISSFHLRLPFCISLLSQRRRPQFPWPEVPDKFFQGWIEEITIF